MVQQNPADKSSLYDTGSRYGWVSILLHWSTAIIIIALWIIGQQIESAPDAAAMRGLHVSIAASAWLLLLLRIAWRLSAGHPRVRGLSSLTHAVAKSAHYLTIAALLIMMTTGPLIVWANGGEVSAFGMLNIPAPFDRSTNVANAATAIHSTAAVALVVLVLLHIGGALKHLMFHNDETFARMLWPGRSDDTGERS